MKILIKVVLIFFFVSCKVEEHKNCKDFYGGSLTLVFTGSYKTIYPSLLNDLVSLNIASLVHSPLVIIDPITMQPMPALAKNWKADSNYTIWTFYLNTNSYFNEDKCFKSKKNRKVKITDVYYTFKLLCLDTINNLYINVLEKLIKGAEFKDEKNIGIKIVNDSTITFYLKKSEPLFIYKISSPIYSIISEQAHKEYGTKLYVGAGPYRITDFENDKSPFVLVKNYDYFLKDEENNCLPYIDTLFIYTNLQFNEQIEMFRNKKIDIWLNLNDEMISYLVSEFKNFFVGEQAPYKVLSINPTDAAQATLKYIIKSNIKDFYINYQNLIYLTNAKKSN